MTDAGFLGVGVALLTVFTDDGSVDVTATAEHAGRMTDAGIRAVLVAGTTGEAETLEDSECEELIAAVRDRIPRDVPVIAGASAAWTRAAAQRAVAARKAGADGVLVLPPRGGKDLVGFYSAVTEAVGESSRVFGYHNPAPLGVPGIPVEELMDLPIGGLKDSSGDPNRLLAELSGWDGAVYVGSAALAGYAGPLGAAGAILAIANALPEDSIAAFEGDLTAQKAMTELHLRIRKDGIAALKEAAAERYGLSPVRRLPLP
jgi:4-hydroxy-tetrahydrodipicolinate synthase